MELERLIASRGGLGSAPCTLSDVRIYSTNWAKEIRHFHKHGWNLPIPLYEADEPLRVLISELGAAAEQECQALIAQSDIMSKLAGDAQSRAARRLLLLERQPNSETAQTIETAVTALLSDPTQAAPAERQMQTRRKIPKLPPTSGESHEQSD